MTHVVVWHQLSLSPRLLTSSAPDCLFQHAWCLHHDADLCTVARLFASPDSQLQQCSLRKHNAHVTYRPARRRWQRTPGSSGWWPSADTGGTWRPAAPTGSSGSGGCLPNAARRCSPALSHTKVPRPVPSQSGCTAHHRCMRRFLMSMGKLSSSPVRTGAVALRTCAVDCVCHINRTICVRSARCRLCQAFLLI